MPLPAHYATGTVTVANGGTTVTGVGTGWVGKVFAGDLFTDPAQGVFARVTADAASDTSLSINAWPGTGLTADPYEILITPDTTRVQERTRQVLELLDEAALPQGGTSGQVLAKAGGTDFDVGWVDPVATADDVSVAPAGGLAATTVQAALEELDTEKQPRDTDLTALASAFAAAGSSGPARLDLAEDTDNGTNYGRLTVPAALGGNRTYTLPDADMLISAYMAGLMASASAAALVAALVGNGVREVLSANRTYYVRSDGNNSNTGLADSAGGAFLTIQRAMDVIATIDLNGYTVTVQVRDGTFAGFTVPVTVGQATVARLVIQGNSSTPANVAITSAIGFGPGARATIKDMAITSSGHGLVADGAGAACAFGNIAFGACTNAQIYVASGATVTMTGNCSFAGGGQVRVWARWNAVYVEEFRTCTYVGTPAYSVANMYILSGARVSSAVSTQTGSATGTRYSVNGNALAETGGGGANFYPGSVAGGTASGGQYT